MATKLREEVSEDGKYLYVYSSSKEQDIFKYYFNREIKYGLNAGSAYGFGTYAILSNPFGNKDAAEIGYSDGVRNNLYGSNCFEFIIPTDKVLFFEYDDYIKTERGKGAPREWFIREQLQEFGIDKFLTEEQITELTPTEDEGFSSRSAQAFYRFMSRIYYQNARGSINCPCAGFVYKGKNDGRTYVGWDSYALIPNRFTNDEGKTWQEVDKNSPEYKDYIARVDDNRDDAEDIFDGHKTKAKEYIYRMFTKFSSADDGSEGMSGGVFSNVVIHDDKTVDCRFRSNLPQVDGYKHFLRLTPNDPFLKAMTRIGFKINKLDAGVKIGSEAGSSYQLHDIPADFYPNECTSGIKLAGLTLNDEEMSHVHTKFDGTVRVIGCEIQDDCLQGFDITTDEKKPSWTPDLATYERLSPVYGGQHWWETVLTEKPAPKAKRQLKNPDAIARAEAKAKEKEERERARNERRQADWAAHADRIMKFMEDDE